MLRVLSLGHSFSQSTCIAFQPFRVSTWDLPLQPLQTCQFRLVWNYAKNQTPENDSDEDEDKGKEGPRPHTCPPAIRKSSFRQELQRKPIRLWKPVSASPKHTNVVQLSMAHAERMIPMQPVHPYGTQQGKDSTLSAPFMDPLPLATPSSSDRRGLLKGPSRIALLGVLAETRSVPQAWEAYDLLLKQSPHPLTHVQNQSDPTAPPVSPIPHMHLHRLARLLSATQPRTRTLYLRLLSVLTTLRDSGGIPTLPEWNALIDCAGKGWRKASVDDYQSALRIFKDMIIFGKKAPPHRDEIGNRSSRNNRPVIRPDIVTFTTLLDIASRSLSKSAIAHATSLLDASELPWSNATHMVKLRYFTRTKQLDSVLEILRGAIHRGLDLATLNGCMWAFARHGRPRVALEVYELLKRNIPARDRIYFDQVDAKPDPSEETIKVKNPILNAVQFVLPGTMRPDKITYSLLVQAMCYYGDFPAAMNIFRDMVSTVDPTLQDHPAGYKSTAPKYFKPCLAIYRAIFLGFARHGHKNPKFRRTLVSKRRDVDVFPLPEFAARLSPSDPGTRACSPTYHQSDSQTHWTLKNLESLFESFLKIGCDDNGTINPLEDPTTAMKPSNRTIYWIMIAYSRTTGGDVRKMHEVLRELHARFGTHEVKIQLGRMARFDEQVENRYQKSEVVKITSRKPMDNDV